MRTRKPNICNDPTGEWEIFLILCSYECVIIKKKKKKNALL
jgi:hypothetical protein